MKKINGIRNSVFLLVFGTPLLMGMDTSLKQYVQPVNAAEVSAMAENISARIKMLEETSFDVRDCVRPKYGKTTPVFDAAGYDDCSEFLGYMLYRGASPDMQTESGCSPLEHAVACDALKAAQRLVDAKADCSTIVPYIIKKGIFHTKSSYVVKYQINLLQDVLNKRKNLLTPVSIKPLLWQITSDQDDAAPVEDVEIVVPAISEQDRIKFAEVVLKKLSPVDHHICDMYRELIAHSRINKLDALADFLQDRLNKTPLPEFYP